MTHPNHDPLEQRTLLTEGTRADVLAWLEWNDPNGDYSDADMEAEGLDPLTLDEAREAMRRQVIENAEPGDLILCEHCEGEGTLNGHACPHCNGGGFFVPADFE